MLSVVLLASCFATMFEIPQHNLYVPSGMRGQVRLVYDDHSGFSAIVNNCKQFHLKRPRDFPKNITSEQLKGLSDQMYFRLNQIGENSTLQANVRGVGGSKLSELWHKIEELWHTVEKIWHKFEHIAEKIGKIAEKISKIMERIKIIEKGIGEMNEKNTTHVQSHFSESLADQKELADVDDLINPEKELQEIKRKLIEIKQLTKEYEPTSSFRDYSTLEPMEVDSLTAAPQHRFLGGYFTSNRYKDWKAQFEIEKEERSKNITIILATIGLHAKNKDKESLISDQKALIDMQEKVKIYVRFTLAAQVKDLQRTCDVNNANSLKKIGEEYLEETQIEFEEIMSKFTELLS